MTTKAEQTKEFIIQKAAPIFNKKGYAGTSLQDLTTATGLTKGSIYGNFLNKDEVAIDAYKFNVKRLKKNIRDFVDDKTSAQAKLKGFTNFYRENWKKMFQRGGCPIQNASIEADDNAPFLKPHVQASMKAWAKGLGRIIEAGQKQGEFRKHGDALAYSYSIISILEGGILLGKIMENKSFLFSALDRIDKLVEKELKK